MSLWILINGSGSGVCITIAFFFSFFTLASVMDVKKVTDIRNEIIVMIVLYMVAISNC